MIIRKNAAKLPRTEQARYVTALQRLKADIQGDRNGVEYGRYDQVVALHLGVTRRQGGPTGDGAHGTPAFLPWHRQYLRWLEGMLRDVDPRVSIPYWDWTDVTGTRDVIFTDDFMGAPASPGGRVTTGNFTTASWPIVADLHRHRAVQSSTSLGTALRRRTSFDFTALPNTSRINFLLGLDVFEDSALQQGFREALEINPHGTLHGWVGGNGTMSGMSSPNDPIFFLHHAAVDWMWARWQSDGHAGADDYPANVPGQGHALDSPMWPWDEGVGSTADWLEAYLPDFGNQRIAPRDVLSSTAIGVLYDTLLPRLAIGGSRALSVGGDGEEDGVRIRIVSPGRYRLLAQGSGQAALGLYGPDNWDEVTARTGAGALDITADLAPGEYFAVLRGTTGAQVTRPLSLTEQISIPDTPTPVSPPVILEVDGDRVSAEIGAPGETDRYRFAVSSSGQYTVETHGPTDVLMSLYGPDNENALVASDDDRGDDRNARLELQLTPGEYSVRVSHYFPTETGDYSIDVRSTGDASTADLAVDGRAVTQQISAPGEIDILQLAIAEAGRYRFRTGGSLDTVLFVVDSRFRVVGWNDDVSPQNRNSEVELNLTAGDYLVAVRLYNQWQTGDYSIEVAKL